MQPSTNGANGRSAGGRFAHGNAGGPGNPQARRVAALRASLLAAVTDDDLQAIVERLVAMAKGGDLAAIRELLDRVLGKPTAAVAIDLTEQPAGVAVIEDPNWYGNEERIATATALRQQLLNEPHYLEWRRQALNDEAKPLE